MFREKHPVRALGTVAERGKTRGTRTIAGSLVFTVFDRHSFADLMIREQFADQLPKFDIVISCANEYGSSARMILYGIELMSEGVVLSVENLVTEATFQFTADNLAILENTSLLEARGALDPDRNKETANTASRNLKNYEAEKRKAFRKALSNIR